MEYRGSPNSVIPFATSYRRDDNELVDPTTPRVTFKDAVGAVSSLVLVKEDVGHYALDWTIPADAPLGNFNFVYSGSFSPFEGADSAYWESDLQTLEIVASTAAAEAPGSVVGLASNALTTVGAVKAELGIADADTTHDPRLKRMINAASRWIERKLNRELARASVTEKLRGYGRDKLLLARYPIVSVTTIEVDGAAAVQGDGPADWDYESQAGGILYREDGWPLQARGYGDLTADIDPRKARRNVKVTYIGGYVLPKDEDDANPRTLPWDIEWVAIRIVKLWYDRDPDMKKETSEAGYSYEVDPRTARALLEDLRSYKRWA